MKDIDILILDGCTEADAIKHLKNGTLIFPDFEENFENYMTEWDADNEDTLMYKKMIDTKKPISDWGIVKHNGRTYYIMYCL